MDFTKVKLGQFASSKLHSNLDYQPKPASYEPPKAADSTELCAESPQFVIKVIPFSPEILSKNEEVLETKVSETSHFMVTTRSGIYIWKYGAPNTLFFPAVGDTEVCALFVPGDPNEPGLVVVDKFNGSILYWETISRAVIDVNSKSMTQPKQAVSVGSKDRIVHLEPAFPVGFLVETAKSNFHIVNLRDETGKININVSKLNFSTLLFMFKAFDPFSKNIATVKFGKLLEDRTKELFIANNSGDIAKWKVGLGGYSEHLNEIKAGSIIHMNMNMIYPNSKMSLLIHDLALESDLVHVLASFEPITDCAMRYLVVATFSADLELLNVQRLQTYEVHDVNLIQNSRLEVLNQTLVVVTTEAIAMVDSPSKQTSPKWEECVYLKPEAHVLDPQVVKDMLIVPTNMGILTYELKPQTSADQESTTEYRLKQAIFNTRPNNPLNLTKWSSYEYSRNDSAAIEIALEIAGESKYLPAKLPNLNEHLTIRRNLLVHLYSLAPKSEVRDLALTFVAAQQLWKMCVENETLMMGVNHEIEAENSLESFLYSNPTNVPSLLAKLATLHGSLADAVLSTLMACDEQNMGMPTWSASSEFITMLKQQVVTTSSSGKVDKLGDEVKLLCAIISLNSNMQSAQDENVKMISKLIFTLRSLGGHTKAKEIAFKYTIYSALVPIDVDEWLDSHNMDMIKKHISEFGPDYSHQVFEYLNSTNKSKYLVQDLAPLYPEEVKEFLILNNLPEIAWTLNPGTQESNENLIQAVTHANDLESREVFASFAKLSAYFTTGTTDSQQFVKSNEYLDLVNIQKNLVNKYVCGLESKCTLTEKKKPLLGKVITAEDAIELLAFAPVPDYPELNDNFVEAFNLVDANDQFYLKLLVQRLILCTLWDPIAKAQDKTEAFKHGLYYVTYSKAPVFIREILKNPSAFISMFTSEEVKNKYSWDLNNQVEKDFIKTSDLCLGLWDQFSIADYLHILD